MVTDFTGDWLLGSCLQRAGADIVLAVSPRTCESALQPAGRRASPSKKETTVPVVTAVD